MKHHALFTTIAGFLAVATLAAQEQSGIGAQDGVSFQSGVEVINVTATVTDGEGRFVSGLHREDFRIYEDGALQEITHFNNDRSPVSLGIALDTSGSMTSDKMSAARAAIDRFVYDLLATDDELFFLQFANRPRVTQDWTTDRRAISRAVARVLPAGGTALYDAIASAIPVAGIGQHPKKALLVISDGNDTNSRVGVGELRGLIRESEVLVYALGVDGTLAAARNPPAIQLPRPFPFPMPRRGPQRRFPPIGGNAPNRARTTAERVNADALRQITDETGGRTEVVRGFGELEGATARLADELSKQYSLGYASAGTKDGRWHDIRVEVRDRKLAVRARRGYIAS